MRKGLILIFLLLAVVPIFGQTQLGLRLSNYSGVQGLQLNPAHNLVSRQSWEAWLGGVEMFVDNDYGFLEESSLLELWRARNDASASLYERPELNPGEQPSGENVFIIDYYPGERKRYVNVLGRISGPGFMVSLESGHTFGAFSNLRFGGGSHQVPAGFSYFPYFDQKFFESFVVEPFTGAAMLWGEIGINYGFSMDTYDGKIGFGANFKYLPGFEGFYFKSSEQVDFTKYPDDVFTSNLAQLRFGYTNSNLDPNNLSIRMTGGGFGLDLGMIYTIDGYEDYPAWRFGASITDIGSVTFRDFAKPQVVNADSLIQVDGNAFDFFDGVDDIPRAVRVFSQQTLQDSLISSAGNQYQIWTPAALNLSADYAVNDYLFVNATLIQRLPIGDVRLSRDNILAITPRLEHKWFDVSMPIVLLNYNQLHLGLSARLGVLHLGTDNLFSLIGQSDLTGMDFYMGVKIPGFLVQTEGSVPPARKRRGGRRVKCYEF
ncbi:MAG: hypothetical protein GYB31_13435 [Bacteroidetes bacterium]|nr:hypothetical protein [Bacteroidota bacterium]